MSYVNRSDGGLLVKGKGGSEIEPLHPKGEAKGSILDPLKQEGISRGSKGEGEWAVSEERKYEGFVQVKFCFCAAVAKSLQTAQGVPGYGGFLFDVDVESEVFIDG